MSWQAVIGLSIAITVVACLIRFAVWLFWPRVIEHDTDAHEMIPPGWEESPSPPKAGSQ